MTVIGLRKMKEIVASESWRPEQPQAPLDAQLLHLDVTIDLLRVFAGY